MQETLSSSWDLPGTYCSYFPWEKRSHLTIKATLLQSGTDETICIVVTVIHPSSTGASGEGQEQKNKLVATPTAYLPQAIAVSQI